MPRKTLTTVLVFIAAFFIATAVVLLWRPVIFPVIAMIVLFHSMDVQMSAGRHYMDSLKPDDIQIWIERSKKLQKGATLGSNSIGTYGFGSDTPVPEDLKKLKILRIDVFEDTVSYVWCGGMDHCELIVEKLSDGTYQVTAQYDDEHRRVLWPKP
jgi:hypothetical protein